MYIFFFCQKKYFIFIGFLIIYINNKLNVKFSSKIFIYVFLFFFFSLSFSYLLFIYYLVSYFFNTNFKNCSINVFLVFDFHFFVQNISKSWLHIGYYKYYK